MAKCLRCKAGNEWIEGAVSDKRLDLDLREARDLINDLVAAVHMALANGRRTPQVDMALKHAMAWLEQDTPNHAR